jgi:hypothetical protein
MTAMQWIIGEKDDKLVLVLSVRRNLDKICAEEEIKYRTAIKDIKELKQVKFKGFSNYLTPSLLKEDRLYLEDRLKDQALDEEGNVVVNGTHYFVYETEKDKKESVTNSIRRLNSVFANHIYVDEQVPLQNHYISFFMALYGYKPLPEQEQASKLP